MQELEDWVNNHQEPIFGMDLEIKINELLKKEKIQHETTFHRGINIGALNPELDVEGRKEASKHYYESTFVHLNNQNK